MRDDVIRCLFWLCALRGEGGWCRRDRPGSLDNPGTSASIRGAQPPSAPSAPGQPLGAAPGPAGASCRALRARGPRDGAFPARPC